MPAGAKITAVFVIAVGAIVSGYFFLIPPDRTTPLEGGSVDDGALAEERSEHASATNGGEDSSRAEPEVRPIREEPTANYLTDAIEREAVAGSGDSGESQDDLAAGVGPGEPLWNIMTRGAGQNALSGAKGDVDLPDDGKIIEPDVLTDSRNASGSESTPEEGTTLPADPPIVENRELARPAESHQASAPAQVYHVKSGDTLSLIAQTWFGDEGQWTLIAEANPGVDPTKLQVGQRLTLPPKTAAGNDSGPRRDAVVADTYIVRSGDTLMRIATRLYGDPSKWRALYDANRQTIGESPNNLDVGMKLTVPRPQ